MKWLLRLREAPVTCALIAANLLVYAIMAVASRQIWSFDSATLIAAGASVSGGGADVSHWRWLTAAFIHANGLHILMNLWVLGQIGVLSERALGRGLYAASYVVTGVIGNVLSTLHAAGRPEMSVSVGASGAIMGLIGMAATFAWRSGQRAAAKALAFNILFVLGVGLSLSARGISLVDNAAHIGGLCAGVVIGLVRVTVRRPVPRWLDATAIGLSFALTAVAFAVVEVQGG
ncbi:MAG TPA: rhomboid family intramembrane serine protease [Polyangia bacterium]|jgi:rhomboid protease GluP|nr:rhomboid family intramembrane serine protease [Polyangia bacterium]